MPSDQLPSTRAFITQLFDALRAAPPAAADEVDDTYQAVSNPVANPLDDAPKSTRKQLLALHVLFPNEVLPALDLLDRRLVTRFRIRREQDSDPDGAAPRAVRRHEMDQGGMVTTNPGDGGAIGAMSHIPSEDQPLMHAMHSPNITMQDALPSSDMLCQDISGLSDTVYYVRSAQQRSRFSSSYDTTTSYEVRLRAWNCSCPAFAFSAFPTIHPEPSTPVHNPDYELQTTEELWTFGGGSLGDGVPPVCKHLLACVLIERCEALFGGCLEEKEISVSEAAGWAAGWGD